MDDPRSAADRDDAVERASAAALGTTPPPEPVPADAQPPVDEQLVPGATHGDRVADEAKPWFTSLAAESDQAGVGNDTPDAQEPDTLDPDARDR
jgi:hypothetical protein